MKTLKRFLFLWGFFFLGQLWAQEESILDLLDSSIANLQEALSDYEKQKEYTKKLEEQLNALQAQIQASQSDSEVLRADLEQLSAFLEASKARELTLLKRYEKVLTLSLRLRDSFQTSLTLNFVLGGVAVAGIVTTIILLVKK